MLENAKRIFVQCDQAQTNRKLGAGKPCAVQNMFMEWPRRRSMRDHFSSAGTAGDLVPTGSAQNK